MTFYSGFSLKNENEFFKDFIKDTEYTVCGFSYGAIKAFEHVEKQLENSKRVDTLQLFSPAFFQTKPSKFKRLQTMGYSKNKDKYLNEFTKACFAPYEIIDLEHSDTSLDELEELLNYRWNQSRLENISDKGVDIEVYIGGRDIVIDVQKAREFFLNVATVTYIKDANHFLQTN